jgi:hypothetical protein
MDSSDYYSNLFKQWQDTTRKFFMPPWMQHQGFAVGMPTSFDPTDLNKIWTETLEKVMQFPPFVMFQGIAPFGATSKEYVALMEDYVNLYKEWIDVYSAFAKAWFEAGVQISARIGSQDSDIKSGVKESALYNVWVEEMEKKMESLLKDQEFAKKLGALLSRSLDIKKRYDSIAEIYFKSLNLPTRSEVDRLYKEMHDLRKEVSERNGGGSRDAEHTERSRREHKRQT